MERRKKRLSKSFRARISTDPMSVADLYSQPDDDDICEPLVRALEDSHKIVRSAAIDSLISLNDMYASTSILWMLLHGNVHARRASAEILGAIGGNDITVSNYLIQAMQDPDKIVRDKAIESLVINSLTSDECQKNAIELLLYFRNDEKKYIRIAAAKALLMIETILGVWIEPVTEDTQDTIKLP
jgi:HEAT repeat protein